jgi:hypothetical protein
MFKVRIYTKLILFVAQMKNHYLHAYLRTIPTISDQSDDLLDATIQGGTLCSQVILLRAFLRGLKLEFKWWRNEAL